MEPKVKKSKGDQEDFPDRNYDSDSEDSLIDVEFVESENYGNNRQSDSHSLAMLSYNNQREPEHEDSFKP